MALIKLTIQVADLDPERTYTWETTDEIMSSSPVVIASALRAIADHYDPPKKVMREAMRGIPE